MGFHYYVFASVPAQVLYLFIQNTTLHLYGPIHGFPCHFTQSCTDKVQLFPKIILTGEQCRAYNAQHSH